MIDITEGYLKVTGGEEGTDTFEDHKGHYRRMTVGVLNGEELVNVVRRAKANRNAFLRILHKRPGVVVDGHELPMDWFQWDQIRTAAWRTT